MTTGGYTLLEAPRRAQKLVHIHAGAEELGRVYAADLMLQASMNNAAKALEVARRAAAVPWRAWTKARPPTSPPTACLTVEPLDMAQVMTVSAPVPEDTVFTNGAGNFSGWLHRYMQLPAACSTTAARSSAPTSGAMGYGVPAAIAASLLYPSAPWSTSPATATS